MRPLDRLRFLGAAMLGAYVAINAIMLAARPFTHGMPQLVSTAVIVPPMVLAMVFLVIPVARRAIQPARSASSASAQA